MGLTTTVPNKNNLHPKHRTATTPSSQKEYQLRMTRTNIPNNPKTSSARMITRANKRGKPFDKFDFLKTLIYKNSHFSDHYCHFNPFNP